MLKYEELVNTLIDEIERGVYKKGERLPTTPRLCEIYGMSNTTVKRAMDVLESHGLVARRRGSGVYIKETSVPGSSTRQSEISHQMSGMTAEYLEHNKQVESDVKGFSVVRPDPSVAEKLDMDPDQFAYRITRVRKVDGKPLVVEYTHMPIDLIPGLRESHLTSSVYGYIEDELGLKVGSAHRVIKAVMPTADEREWLQIGDNEPLLEVRQVAYLADGTPFEFSVSRHTSDYEFFSISTR